MVHAARSRRWRIRDDRVDSLAAQQASQPMADANIVTHQGSHGNPTDAPLLAWTKDQAEVSLTANPDESEAPPVDYGAHATCRRCGAKLGPWVRQRFLRSAAGVRSRHDHSP